MPCHRTNILDFLKSKKQYDEETANVHTYFYALQLSVVLLAVVDENPNNYKYIYQQNILVQLNFYVEKVSQRPDYRCF